MAYVYTSRKPYTDEAHRPPILRSNNTPNIHVFEKMASAKEACHTVTRYARP